MEAGVQGWGARKGCGKPQQGRELGGAGGVAWAGHRARWIETGAGRGPGAASTGVRKRSARVDSVF